MITFKTYQELDQYLKGHTDLCMTRRYLNNAIKDEASFLVKSSKEKGKEAKQKYTKQAQEDYLEEINEYLASDIQITAMSVMGYRRRIHSWAIAGSIKDYIKAQEA